MPLAVNFNFVPVSRKPAKRRLLRTSDGDTPYIEEPIRMVSCDTPEKDQSPGSQQSRRRRWTRRGTA